jgi:tellurite resistance protein TerC
VAFLDMFLFGAVFGQPSWMWLTFIGLIVTLLAFDLGLFSGRNAAISVRSSVALSLVYVSFGLVFGLWVWWMMGAERGMEYFTGFCRSTTFSCSR